MQELFLSVTALFKLSFKTFVLLIQDLPTPNSWEACTFRGHIPDVAGESVVEVLSTFHRSIRGGTLFYY